MSEQAAGRGAATGAAADGGPAIDVAHLSRMTLGDRALMREVLALFEGQIDALLAQIRAGGPEARVAAHTLKGSAAGIGADAVARTAAAVEQAGEAAREPAVAALAAALAEARAAIAGLKI